MQLQFKGEAPTLNSKPERLNSNDPEPYAPKLTPNLTPLRVNAVKRLQTWMPHRLGDLHAVPLSRSWETTVVAVVMMKRSSRSSTK